MIPGPPPTDGELCDLLLRIDQSDDIRVTKWEAEFIDSAVYKHAREWTVKQRAIAAKIADKYIDKI